MLQSSGLQLTVSPTKSQCALVPRAVVEVLPPREKRREQQPAAAMRFAHPSRTTTTRRTSAREAVLDRVVQAFSSTVELEAAFGVHLLVLSRLHLIAQKLSLTHVHVFIDIVNNL